MMIYIIPAWYPQDEKDITACFFREQAHALADRGHDVTVIHIEPLSVTRIGQMPFHSRREWQDGNVRTIFHKVIVPVPAKLGDIQDHYISELYYKIIKKQIDEDEANGLAKPELLHAHVSHSCAYYCLKASKKLGIPLVVTEHYSGLLLGTATEREYRRVRDTIEGADAFIFVGTNFKKAITEKLKTTKETYYIPNMLPNDMAAKTCLTEQAHTPFTFLTACHLKENKSVDLAIKAFHEAFEPEEDVKLIIAGDGTELPKLKALADELNENRIEFYGRYSREESQELFSQADAFVLTSKVETFGIVYLEAMNCGLPCIATKGQGGDDIIDDKNGILVDYGDIEQLKIAMRKIKEDYGNYSRSAIAKSCRDRFSQGAVVGQIAEKYESVSGRPRGG